MEHINYYDKYVKYKIKYKNLQQRMMEMIGINNNPGYIDMLKKLYPKCVHDGELDTNLYPVTYGEMEYQAIEKINNMFNDQGQYKYFIDFGSGRGKLPLFMCDKVTNKSIGVELIKVRHDDAVNLYNQLKEKYPNIEKKVELLQGDMFEYLDKISLTTFDSPVMIWVSNLCFTDELTKKLIHTLADKMPKDSLIMLSKSLYDFPERVVEFNVNNGSNTINVEMSWSDDSRICVYKLL